MNRAELTPEQSLAVSRRSSLLVSAAAGSGKTRVLTERLMSYVTDEDDPCGIDEFLVITYTRAAAAELRSRVIEELSKISGENPQNRRLRRQSILCYRAQIGTIHSFCTTILRENCHKLSLSPDFIVGDEDKCVQLKEKALEKTLEDAYSRINEDPDFAALVESVGSGRDDARLMNTILQLHEKMQSHPYPERWARERISAMELTDGADAGTTVWGAELMERAGRTSEFWIERLNALWDGICENDEENAPLISAYGSSLLTTIEALHSFRNALNLGWDNALDKFPIPFPPLKPLKNYEFDDRKKIFTSVREAAKKALGELSGIFDSPSNKLLFDLGRTFPSMRALLELTLEFDRRYAGEKRRRGILDFSDLEHFAVKLLCDDTTGGPSATARELSSRYREILIDEFQDVNAVQDLIFRCVSKEGGNIFTVGDVKQSIYRFRLADPGIFLDRLASLPPASEAAPGEAAKVLLKNNFRSDRRILDSCNMVFRSLMSRRLGDIDYDDDCALYPPDGAPPPRGEAKLTILQIDNDDDSLPGKCVQEASYVASRIKSLIDSGTPVMENGALRPMRYSDIVILLRSPGSVGSVYKNALAKTGVPVSAQQGGGFFSAPEVVVLTALLTVIGNPHRDVPLTAVLSSPLFGFTADELAQIRVADKNADFYTALEACAHQNEKCGEFIDILNELRSLSFDLGVHDLICHIYERLELPELWTAVKGSGDGTVNLTLYSELAGKFENGGFRGLTEFLARLSAMEKRGQEPAADREDRQNAVAIMSIHKSKGLEFPVVFLADTSRKFNKNDLRLPVLIHPELGLGAKVTDNDRGIEFPTLAYRAIKSRLEGELLSEEMRVLYVAMTRARERLYITCTSPDPDALIEKLSSGINSPASPETLRIAPSISHWLITAALCGSSGGLELETACPEIIDEVKPEAETTDIPIVGVPAGIRAALDYRYPFEYAAGLPSKLTATALPGTDQDGEASPLLKLEERLFKIPDLFGGTRPLTGAERGVATHIVMQFIDFSFTGSLDGIEAEISRIKALGNLTERQASAVDRQGILRFFASGTGRRICLADRVLREFRFSLLCSASDFYPGAGDEKLLLQGVVDCCIDEPDGITIVDYKTDHVTPESLDAAAEHYRPQLDAYALAMERIMKKPVKSRILCFLRAGLEVKM